MRFICIKAHVRVMNLVSSGRLMHAVVLILLNRYGKLTLTEIRYAISERMGEPAPTHYAASILRELEMMGFIEEREEGAIEGHRTRVVKAYQLTEKGRQAAKTLEEMIGLPH